MSLREKICQEIYEAYQSGIDHNQVPFKYPPMGETEIRESADAAIQAMREALLQPEVVEAMVRASHELPAVLVDSQSQRDKMQAERMMQAALAAMGAVTED